MPDREVVQKNRGRIRIGGTLVGAYHARHWYLPWYCVGSLLSSPTKKKHEILKSVNHHTEKLDVR